MTSVFGSLKFSLVSISVCFKGDALQIDTSDAQQVGYRDGALTFIDQMEGIKHVALFLDTYYQTGGVEVDAVCPWSTILVTIDQNTKTYLSETATNIPEMLPIGMQCSSP